MSFSQCREYDMRPFYFIYIPFLAKELLSTFKGKCFQSQQKASFNDFECPFNDFECPFNSFECPFNSFECPFNSFERNFLLVLKTISTCTIEKSPIILIYFRSIIKENDFISSYASEAFHLFYQHQFSLIYDFQLIFRDFFVSFIYNV